VDSFAIVSPPPQNSAAGEKKAGPDGRFLEAQRQKTIDVWQQVPHNLASLLLTNTTLRSSRPDRQCPGLAAGANTQVL
jgi:hypothetical protein